MIRHIGVDEIDSVAGFPVIQGNREKDFLFRIYLIAARNDFSLNAPS